MDFAVAVEVAKPAGRQRGRPKGSGRLVEDGSPLPSRAKPKPEGRKSGRKALDPGGFPGRGHVGGAAGAVAREDEVVDTREDLAAAEAVL